MRTPTVISMLPVVGDPSVAMTRCLPITGYPSVPMAGPCPISSYPEISRIRWYANNFYSRRWWSYCHIFCAVRLGRGNNTAAYTCTTDCNSRSPHGYFRSSRHCLPHESVLSTGLPCAILISMESIHLHVLTNVKKTRFHQKFFAGYTSKTKH